MFKKNIVIATHSLNEAITKYIIENIQKFEYKITVIHLKEFIYDYEIFDEINDSDTIIKWYKKDHGYISNKDHLLLNRILYFPKSIFLNFINKDREYAQRELEAYLGFAFNAFLGIGNKTTKGICEKIIPLPQQWQNVIKISNLKVPKYYWGPSYGNPLNKNNPLVYSSIYNFLNWKPTDCVHMNKHIFCFERPPGEPVFIFSIGSQQLITSDFVLSEYMTNKIRAIARKINKAIKYFISEVLIFVDGKSITFGCVNAEIVKSCKNIYFDEFVYKNLMNEFHKCIN